MAALKFVLRIAAVTTGTSALTVIQLVMPANQRGRIKEIGVGFHGISNTDPPVTVDLCQQTTAGTSSALTPVPEDASLPETVQSTALKTFSAEPGASTPIRTWSIHPQTSGVIPLALNDEIQVGGGKRVGLRVTSSVSQTVDAYLVVEE